MGRLATSWRSVRGFPGPCAVVRPPMHVCHTWGLFRDVTLFPRKFGAFRKVCLGCDRSVTVYMWHPSQFGCSPPLCCRHPSCGEDTEMAKQARLRFLILSSLTLERCAQQSGGSLVPWCRLNRVYRHRSRAPQYLGRNSTEYQSSGRSDPKARLDRHDHPWRHLRRSHNFTNSSAISYREHRLQFSQAARPADLFRPTLSQIPPPPGFRPSALLAAWYGSAGAPGTTTDPHVLLSRWPYD